MSTRNRPQLFAAALDSVMAQDFVDFEIVIAEDGSAEVHEADYAQILQRARTRLGDRLQAHTLLRRSRGHGSGYPMNFGVERARGRYVCFLDDDDLWIDPGHLERAAQALRAADAQGRPVDMYMTNQEALRNGRRVVEPVWTETLASRLHERGRRPDARGAFTVDIDELLQASGFCHMNCMCVRREPENQSA